MDFRLVIVIVIGLLGFIAWGIAYGLSALDSKLSAIVSLMTSIQDSLEKIEMRLEESNQALDDIKSDMHDIKNKIAPSPSFLDSDKYLR